MRLSCVLVAEGLRLPGLDDGEGVTSELLEQARGNTAGAFLKELKNIKDEIRLNRRNCQEKTCNYLNHLTCTEFMKIWNFV